ncbi:tryptophan-rich sensory protein [Romeria aff. gracilis LEGE 07310]|uniref:Tryptophan-rich sensory protein n=1 Tax=Vasconcelosia minhoensis LEGE 07310 TaxID=915328 RepID=A0A8J7ATF0_9CYAN|nr:tryptophan-rich sensory protein [Romeria aff. gracilis LEGE 07310]
MAPRCRQGATFAAVFAAIIVNALSNFFPLGGANIGEIANTVFADVKITPANYAFAIWGLIYVGLIGFSFYQARPKLRFDPSLRQTAYGVIGACLCQIAWVFAFQLRYFWLSVLLMVGILACLIGAYRASHRAQPPARQRRWLLQIPISLYLSWITVATVVNVASALVASGWGQWTLAATTWTILMVIVSALIAAVVTTQYKDATFPAVTIWALIAIALRATNPASISLVASGLAAVLGLLTLWLNLPKPKPAP